MKNFKRDRARIGLKAGVIVASLLVLCAAPANAQGLGPQDVDAFAMFAGAVPVVKAVMLALILTSFCSWTFFVAKLLQIRGLSQRAAHAAGIVAESHVLEDLRGVKDRVVLEMTEAVQREMSRSSAFIQAGMIEGSKERITDGVVRIEARHVSRVRGGMPMLASVGSVAPFVGLFGTVWGIMHSFMGIAGAGSTSLAAVAPGISEALLATALGLVAAIPATIMYNILTRYLQAYKQNLSECASEVCCMAGREIDSNVLQQDAGSQRTIPLVARREALHGYAV
ncbi:biopolymer transport protein ExbB [Rhizomicrobium palustre]|uniref:Biopolymer transport protein ExbB n=1 Tax=Rhizomicrobium palustre TaxID=189966 RepID=A0A846MYW4_9PROT|nr:tonB-system energizer ExbB [Rhizomicrobium palustre]NIK88503.1 biopolymer transport protein ExbB [Rhizomicrobium palustre]